MTGSASSIIMLGLGNGTFAGSPSLVITLGYGISNLVVVAGPYIIDASQSYVPGSIASDFYNAGSSVGYAHAAGSQAGDFR